MRLIALVALVLLGALGCAAADGRQDVVKADGLAAKYPGDVGLEKDPAVLLYEGFEQDLKLVPWMQPGGWFDIDIGSGKGAEYSAISPAAGKRCLQYNLKTGKQGSGGMFHLLPPSDTIYFRYYRRFPEDWQWPEGYGPHDAMLFGGAWTAPTDTDLSIYADFWMTGDTVVRIASAKQQLGYDGWHQYLKQRYPRPESQDPPGGNAFPWNRSIPDKIVPGKWHCVEVMVKLSTPGKNDGEIRLWVNGKLVSEYTDVPLRDGKHPDLKLNMVFLAPYFHPGSPRDQIHWADGLVVATKYIGPIAPRKAAVEPRTFVYKRVDGCEIKADVYSAGEGPRPVILWVHGGALIFGERGGDPRPSLREQFLGAGYHVVSIDYRLAPETKLPEIAEDLQDAYRWVRERGPALFGADPERIAVAGGSAGGYLTLLAGCLLRPRPRALVSFYGYGDLVGDWYSRPDPYYCTFPLVPAEEAYGAVGHAPVAEGAASGRDRFYLYCRQQGLWPREVVGRDPATEPAAFDPWCPVRHVDAAYPPTLLLHGDQDTDVPYQQSVMMAEALSRAGVKHEFITIPGGGHGFDGEQNEATTRALAQVMEFLAKAL